MEKENSTWRTKDDYKIQRYVPKNEATKFLMDAQAGCGKDSYVFILCSFFYPGMWLAHISQTPWH